MSSIALTMLLFHHCSPSTLGTEYNYSQGHYFLNNPATFEFLSKFIAEKTVDLLLVQCEDSNFVNEDLVSTVANTFSKVLKIPLSGVDRHSNFFDLGGTSLDTMTLTTLLKAAENINVTQNEFFMHPTV